MGNGSRSPKASRFAWRYPQRRNASQMRSWGSFVEMDATAVCWSLMDPSRPSPYYNWGLRALGRKWSGGLFKGYMRTVTRAGLRGAEVSAGHAKLRPDMRLRLFTPWRQEGPLIGDAESTPGNTQGDPESA